MIPERTLKRLYRSMLRIRLVEDAIAALYPGQKMRCPVHLCTGQEAVAAGVCAHLDKRDWVFSAHRSHGHYLAKGGSLPEFFAEIYGKGGGCTGGKGGSMHLLDQGAGFMGATPIVGSTIPIGVGAGLGSVMLKKKRISTVFFGEGAVEEGVFYESVNFALLDMLPVLFVCENNLYSVNTPLSERQPKGLEICERVSGLGMRSFQEDGNDVLKVYRAAGKACQAIRSGKGPAFLEFKTYRLHEHCGPYNDLDLGYRSRGEWESWKRRCPIKAMEKYLVRKKVCRDRDFKKAAEEIKGEIRKALDFASRSPYPARREIDKDVYA